MARAGSDTSPPIFFAIALLPVWLAAVSALDVLLWDRGVFSIAVLAACSAAALVCAMVCFRGFSSRGARIATGSCAAACLAMAGLEHFAQAIADNRTYDLEA